MGGRPGDGPPVLLIAGLGGPAEAWTFQQEGLSSRYRTIAFDHRGVGRSPLPDTPLTMAAMADDAPTILDRLLIEQADLVGFSGGSVTAQELAIRHPAPVKSLVLVGTSSEAPSATTPSADAATFAASTPERRTPTRRLPPPRPHHGAAGT